MLPDNIKKTKLEHLGWTEYAKAKERGQWPLTIPPVFGQWQYWYESEKGIIDAVELPNYFRDGVTMWEIYASHDNSPQLFEDVERFDTLEEAEERIKELLA